MAISKQEYLKLFGDADPDAMYEEYRDLCRERRLDELELIENLVASRRYY